MKVRASILNLRDQIGKEMVFEIVTELDEYDIMVCGWTHGEGDTRQCSNYLLHHWFTHCARNGYLSLIIYGHDSGILRNSFVDGSFFENVAFGGHLNVLQWLKEFYGDSLATSYVCYSAARGGHIHVVEWFCHNYHDCVKMNCPLIGIAANNGHLDFIKWAREKQLPWDVQACSRAAGSGHLELLIWLRENGCPWDKETTYRAANGGNLDVLKWALENGCPWHDYITRTTALVGNLEMLMYARSQGCPWDKWTCAFAARSGFLEVLQWAITNGCPWDFTMTLEFALTGREKHVIDWLNENAAADR